MEQHAPLKKKVVRSNEAPYMTKDLKKAIMKRSELETKYYRSRLIVDIIRYRKQKNFVSRLYKKERKRFYNNLEVNKLTDNKLFWKTIKPLFSDKSTNTKQIVLNHDDNIISNEKEVAETLNTFFRESVRNLGIVENEVLPNIISR